MHAGVFFLTTTLRMVESQIKEIFLELVKETQEFASKDLKNIIEKEYKDVKNKKKKKYLRDIADYQTNQVFKWQSIV